MYNIHYIYIYIIYILGVQDLGEIYGNHGEFAMEEGNTTTTV